MDMDPGMDPGMDEAQAQMMADQQQMDQQQYGIDPNQQINPDFLGG